MLASLLAGMVEECNQCGAVRAGTPCMTILARAQQCSDLVRWRAQPSKKSIPSDDGFKYTTRNNRAELLARYTVPDDARTGSSVSVVIGAP